MPLSVRMFVGLAFGSYVVALAKPVFFRPEDLWNSFDRIRALDLGSFGTVLVFLLVLPILASPFVLIWLAAFKRQNWSRWVLAIIFVGGLAVSLINPASTIVTSTLSVAIYAIQKLMQIASIVCVFCPSANAWFHRNGVGA